MKCPNCKAECEIRLHPLGGYQFRCPRKHWRQATRDEVAGIMEAYYRGIRYKGMEIPSEPIHSQ